MIHCLMNRALEEDIGDIISPFTIVLFFKTAPYKKSLLLNMMKIKMENKKNAKNEYHK